MTPTKLLAATASLLALAACQSPTARPSSAGTNPNEVQFITNAYQIIKFDQEEGALATTQARDPRVKDLAAKIVGEADQFEQALAPLAANAGIKPPTVLREDLRSRLGLRRVQYGLGFDRSYLDDQIASHEEALKQENAMKVQDTDPTFKRLADQGLVLIQMNLTALKALRDEMKAAG